MRLCIPTLSVTVMLSGLVALMLCCLCHGHPALSLSCCVPRPCGHAMLSCHGHAAMLCYLATAMRPCHGLAVLPSHSHAMLSCHYLAMWPRCSHAMLPGQCQAALLCCSLAAQSLSCCPVTVMLCRHCRVAFPWSCCPAIVILDAA